MEIPKENFGAKLASAIVGAIEANQPPPTAKGMFQAFDEYGSAYAEACLTEEEAAQSAMKRCGKVTWEECSALGICIGQLQPKWVRGWKAEHPK